MVDQENGTALERDNEESMDDVLKQLFSDVDVNEFEAHEDVTPEKTPEQRLAESAIPRKTEDAPVDNDTVRYNYWQSEAAKKDAELAKVSAELSVYKQLTTPKEQAPVETGREKFPPPPQKPKPPLGYNQQQAMEDPTSESAKFAMQYAQWQDSMLEYNTLRAEWLEALLEEQQEEMSRRDKEAARKVQEQAAMQKLYSDTATQVVQKYGVTEDVAYDFVQKMSQEQPTIENLFELYKIKYGIGKGKKQQPSPDFAQQRNAASLGVGITGLPTGVQPQGSIEDKLINAMANSYNRQTDW